MKKLLVACAMLFFVGKLHAAVPTDQITTGNAIQNTTIWGSSVAVSGGAAQLVFPATTKTVGSSTINGRNCLTNLTVQLSVNSTFYIIDGGVTSSATNYVLFGTGLGTSGTQTRDVTRDHLGPICGSAGNALTVLIPAPGVATVNNQISAEGYTYYSPFLNGGLNNGQ